MALAPEAQALRYWEDLRVTSLQRLGPFVVSTQELTELDQLLASCGPALTNPEPLLPAHRQVPALFLAGYVGGRSVFRSGPLAIVCIRSATYETYEPVWVDEPFWFEYGLLSHDVINEQLGIAVVVVRIENARGQRCFEGRSNFLMMRRPTGEGEHVPHA